jgi:hypothetical protein
MQARVYSGQDFEKTMAKNGWKLVTVSPKLKWVGNGRNNLQKIKNIDYDPSKFKLDSGSFLEKYDLFNPITKKFREVKRYKISDIYKWTLYSEPYFKIATERQTNFVDPKTYNNFVERFYDLNIKTGLFNEVEKKMTRLTEGIQFVDGFVPKSDLEFRTVVLDGWSGYKRITIQFRKK